MPSKYILPYDHLRLRAVEPTACLGHEEAQYYRPNDRHPAQQDDLVAPIELVGFPRREAQRDVGRRRRLPALLAPPSGVAPHGIIAAVVAAPAQLLEDAD